MRKTLLLLILTLFSFSAIHAEITWNLSEDGTLTISGTGDMTNYSYSEPAPWYSRREEIKKIVIENGVRNIRNYAFCDCSSLTSVEIPNSVTGIGNYSFQNCNSLTSITIPNSVTSIGIKAFISTSNLSSINVESGNPKYDSRGNCNAIIETNSNNLFIGCKNTVIPNSVTSIGNNAFFGVDLISIEIPNSVTSIGDNAFSCCNVLTSVEIPNSVTSIGIAVFDRCESLTSVTIPNSVTSIGDYAFYYCTALTSVTIGNSITSIGDFAFTNTALTSVEIPNSVTSIGRWTFSGCLALTSVEIPSSVTSIGQGAFAGCAALASVVFKGSAPPEFENFVFDKVNKSISVSVPVNSIEAYKSALGGLGLSDIKAAPLIYLKDGEAYTQDSQIDGMDISYTRSFANTNWQALYLPFSLNYEDWKDDFEVAYINTVRQYDDNGDGRADRTIMEAVKKNSGSTAPNTPYLIRAKTAGEKTFFVENATLYPAENNSVDCSTTTARFTFTGIYKEKSFGLSASNYYAINQGRLTTLSAWLPVPPYRWYMIAGTRSSVYGTGSGWAKEISISVVGEEETTEVADIQHLSPDTQIFDINGRKVSEKDLKPGIYVKNGKKFVIK